MRLVDMILPRGLINAGFRGYSQKFPSRIWLIRNVEFFAALTQSAIAIASLPYLAAALPVIVGLLVLIQRFYLRTSRQLRLLE